jgi:hypothetical protein
MRLAHRALIPTIILAGLTVEALLLTRLWAQLTDRAASGFLGIVFSVTDVMVSPFRSLEPYQSARQTGVFELATLYAMEAYLIATLVSIAAVVLLTFTWRLSALTFRTLAGQRSSVTEPAAESQPVPQPLPSPDRAMPV